jgi:hypothetical protein
MSDGASPVDLRERNQRLLRVILAIMGALIIASFIVGIRW